MADQGDSEANEGGQSGQPQGGQPQGGQPQGGQPQGGQPQGAQPQAGQPQGGQPQAGGQPAGGQPQAGGQPVGGQPQGGQPQGGQPQAGGQPAGGQPQGGQPQAGQPQGQYQQQQVQTGPQLGDIINRPDTKAEIKLGLITYLIIGAGAGIAMMGIGFSIDTGTSSLGNAFAAAFLVASLIGVPIAVVIPTAFILATKIESNLSDVPDKLVYATVGLTTGAGSFASIIVAWFLTGLSLGEFAFGDAFLPWIMTALGAAAVGAGVVWLSRGYDQSDQAHQQPVNQQH